MKFSCNISLKRYTSGQFFKIDQRCIEGDFHPIQNIVLISLKEKFSTENINILLRIVREKLIKNFGDLIADEKLDFDIMIAHGNQIERYTVSAAAKTFKIVECDNNMYGVQFSSDLMGNPNLSSSSSALNISEFGSSESGDNPSKMINDLLFGSGPEKDKNKVNYQQFINDWKPYFKDAEVRDKFLKIVKEAPTNFYIAKDRDGKSLGAFAKSSSADQKLHYLSFLIVDQNVRQQGLAQKLIKKALSDMPEGSIALFYTTNPIILKKLEKLGIKKEESRLSSNPKIISEIPIVHTFTSNVQTSIQFKS